MKKRIPVWLISCTVVCIIFLAGCNGGGGEWPPVSFGGKLDFNPGLAGKGTGGIEIEIREYSDEDDGFFFSGVSVRDGKSVGSYAILNEVTISLDTGFEDTMDSISAPYTRTIDGIPSGPHILKVSCSGFDTFISIITVKADDYVHIDVHLEEEDTSAWDSYEPNNDKDNACADFYNYNSPPWEYKNWGSDGRLNCYYTTIDTVNIHSYSDEDWFRVYLHPDRYIDAELTSVPDGCNYNVELYDGSNEEPIAYGDENDKISNYPITSEDNYYIRVSFEFEEYSNFTENYSLYLEVEYD